MIDDARARELLEAAGQDVGVRSLEAATMVALSRRSGRRRAVAIVGVVAVVCLVVGGGLIVRPDLSLGGPAAKGPTATPTAGPVINTSESDGRDIMGAQVGGTLEVSSDGCLVVDQGGALTDILWPKDFSVATRSDGSVVVQDPTGHTMAVVGSSFTAAGGYVPVSGDLACRAAPPTADVMFVQANIKQLNDAVPLISTTDWEPGDPYMRAIVGGLLQISADGCLFVQRDSRRIDLAWPKDFTVARVFGGRVVVRDPSGRRVAVVGSPFQASGGYVPTPSDMTCRAGSPHSVVAYIQTDITMARR